MIVPEELAIFVHGDLHALPCPGLQQADTRPLSTNFYVVQKMSLKTIYVLTNPFWTVQYLLWPFLSCEKGLTDIQFQTPKGCVIYMCILIFPVKDSAERGLVSSKYRFFDFLDPK